MWPFKPSIAKLQSRKDTGALADLLRSGNLDTRSGAAVALQAIGNADAKRALFAALSDGSEETTKAACKVLTVEDIASLEAMGTAGEEPLCILFKHRLDLVVPLCEALGRIGGTRAEATLCWFLDDDPARFYEVACRYAGVPYVPGLVPDFIVETRHESQSPGILAAVKALGSCGGPEAIPVLESTVNDDDPLVSRAAADVLAQPRFAHPTDVSSPTPPRANPAGDQHRTAPEGTAPPGYGLSPQTPVMCGGGRAAGPAHERAYLERLRCPAGQPFRYERSGSTNPMLSGDPASLQAKLQEIEAALESNDFERLLSPQDASVDIYQVACLCGQHRATVYMNMYADGPDAPVDLADYSLAD